MPQVGGPATVLSPGGRFTLRGTPADAVVIGIYYKHPDTRNVILASGYDGACTQFASDGITEGARTSAWPEYRQWAHENGLLFITAVAPGFDDSKTNPGNRLSKFAKRARANGGYYEKMWRAAIGADADVALVTSYNHWGDGTQIEPAAENPAAAASIDNPKGEVMHNGRMVEVEHIGEYQSYSPQPEDFYMVQTAEWAKGFALRKAEELIEWTKTHGLKREL